MQREPRPRSHSRIPVRYFERPNQRMKHSLNSPTTPVGNPSEKHQQTPRRDSQNQRSSAVNYQPASRHPSDLEAYMPPQQPSKHAGYSTSRSNTKHIFEKDFGPFGTVPQQHVKSDVGDISSMFNRRSDYQPLPCLMQQQQTLFQQQQQQQSPNSPRPAGVNCTVTDRTAVLVSESPNGTGGVIMGGTTWQTEAIPNRNGNILIRSQLPSINQPPVISGISVVAAASTSSQRSLRRNEDVDRILNKYGRSSKSPRDVENNNKDPDFAAIGPEVYVTTPDKYCKQKTLKQGFQGYWDPQRSLTQNIITPQRRRNVQDNSPDIIIREQVSSEVGIHSGRRFIEEATVYHQNQQQQLSSSTGEKMQMAPAFTFKPSSHIFPFKETPDGHLLVEPTQIAFESKKICVLMSDPNNNTTIEFKTHNNGGAPLSNIPSKHERILHEVKRAMTNAETDIYGRSQSLYGMRHGITSSYSESKKATEEFEQRLLLRVNCGRNADTHVMIGDKVFPCHSIALEAFSAYFDRLSRPPENIQNVYLPENEVSADAFPIVMDWLVQSTEGRQEIPKKENLVSLYIAAKYLGIKELETQCMTFMEGKVDSNDPNLIPMWDAVKKRQSLCPDLVRIIASKLAASYHDIYKSKKYLQMDVDELVMLLSSDDISIESEMDVYNSAVTWLLHDFKNRKLFTNKIMSTVRFGLLSPLQLTQISRCPEIANGKSEKDFNQLMTFGTVKAMIDDGLSYSILDESYKSQPEELKKWVDKTGMKVPTQRTALLRKKLRGGPLVIEKISLLEDASHQDIGNGRPLQKSSSYTLINTKPRPETPRIDSEPPREMYSSQSAIPKTVSNAASRNLAQGSKSRIPTKSNPVGQRPPPASSKPTTFVYKPADSNPDVHELSKPKLFTNSPNGSDTEEGMEETMMRAPPLPRDQQHSLNGSKQGVNLT